MYKLSDKISEETLTTLDDAIEDQAYDYIEDISSNFEGHPEERFYAPGGRCTDQLQVRLSFPTRWTGAG